MHFTFRFVFALVFIFLSESFGHTGGSPLAGREAGKVLASTKVDSMHTVSSAVSGNYLSGYTRDTALLYTYCFSKDSIPSYPDSIYSGHITSIESSIPLIYNHHVRKYIEFYSTERRYMLSKIIGRGYDYFPVLKNALEQNSMPRELINLAAIESALDTNALSKCGALGMWQFMPGTARLYKLKVNNVID